MGVGVIVIGTSKSKPYRVDIVTGPSVPMMKTQMPIVHSGRELAHECGLDDVGPVHKLMVWLGMQQQRGHRVGAGRKYALWVDAIRTWRFVCDDV